MTDPNWFYSTISQCSAAIVGFFGAFLITKIISRESEYNIIKQNILQLKSEIEYQKKCLECRYFNWYNRQIRNKAINSKDLQDLINKKYPKSEEDLDDIIYNLNFSEYDSLTKIKNAIKENLSKYTKDNRLMPFIDTSIFINNQKEITEEIDKIKLEENNSYLVIEKIKILNNNIKAFPESKNIIQLLLIIITLLFYIGIIYPITFMPLRVNEIISLNFNIVEIIFKNNISHQSALIILVSILFTIIVIIFGRINYKQTFTKEDVDYLIKYMNISEYSIFLKNKYEYNIWYDQMTSKYAQRDDT